VVVTASPELGYTRTNDDILDPEIHHIDSSIQQRVCVCMWVCVCVNMFQM